MNKYKQIEDELNKEALRMLAYIREDYFNYMSSKNKTKINKLISDRRIVSVDEGTCILGENTLAHGGRTLKDGKIHFYPEASKADTYEGIIMQCKKLLPHECFHYFIQPDNIKFNSDKEERMAEFYTEGLVEKETRKFLQWH